MIFSILQLESKEKEKMVSPALSNYRKEYNEK